MAEHCPRCKSEMDVVRKDIVADTKYTILRCKKCNHQVARRKD